MCDSSSEEEEDETKESIEEVEELTGEQDNDCFEELALKRMRTLMTQTGIARSRSKGRTIFMLMMRKPTINLPATSGKIQSDLKYSCYCSYESFFKIFDFFSKLMYFTFLLQ